MSSAEREEPPPEASSGELPVSLHEGNLRVGSSYALVGVPPFWVPFTPAPSAGVSPGGLFLGAHLQRDAAPYHRLRLAQTLRCKRFLACARVKLWWMQPSWGSRGEEVPPETQFLLLELGQDGPYAVILPLICDATSGAMFRCTVRGFGGRNSSSVYAIVESGDPAAVAHTLPALLYVGGGSDPYEVLATAFRRVSEHLGTFTLREDKPAPPCLDTFGWCTWDAFYHSVSSSGVSAGLSSLSKIGTPARFLIIDDGWQTVSADPEFRRLSLLSVRARATDAIALLALPLRLLAWAALGALALVGAAIAVLLALDYPVLAASMLALWLLPRLAGLLSLAAAMESFYWRRIHTLAYGSRGWRALAYIAHEPLVRRRIRAAASALGTFNHRLTSLGANSKFRRPGEGASHGLATEAPLGGLASVVAHAKQVHGVRQLYVWHALHGYWGGVAPYARGLAGRNGVTMVDVVPSPGLLEVEPSMAWDPITLGGIGARPLGGFVRR
jgi:raffinose synthase